MNVRVGPWRKLSAIELMLLFFYFIFLIFISWRLITLQYCSGFCHTQTWISHGYTCIPHLDPPSHLPLQCSDLVHWESCHLNEHLAVPFPDETTGSGSEFPSMCSWAIYQRPFNLNSCFFEICGNRWFTLLEWRSMWHDIYENAKFTIDIQYFIYKHIDYYVN